METAIKIMTALTHPTRLQAMRLLFGEEEVCLCKIMNQLKLSRQKALRAMTELKKAGLVTARADGEWVRYRLCEEFPPAIKTLLCACRALEWPIKAIKKKTERT